MQTTLLALTLCFTACFGGAARFNGVEPVPEIFATQPEHINVLRARIAASNDHDFATWESLHTEDCVRHAPEAAQPIRGRAAMRAALERLEAAFPDYHVSLVRAVVNGPWVAAQLRSYGTMEHWLERPGHLSLPPTGKSFAQEWTAFIRFDNNRIAEIYESYDRTDLNDQLMGLAKPKSW